MRSAVCGICTLSRLSLTTALFATQEHDDALDAAMAAAGIERWELYSVDNKCCDGAPLGVPDGVISETA